MLPPRKTLLVYTALVRDTARASQYVPVVVMEQLSIKSLQAIALVLRGSLPPPLPLSLPHPSLPPRLLPPKLPCMRKKVVRKGSEISPYERFLVNLHANHRPSHSALRSGHAMFAWSVKKLDALLPGIVAGMRRSMTIRLQPCTKRDPPPAPPPPRLLSLPTKTPPPPFFSFFFIPRRIGTDEALVTNPFRAPKPLHMCTYSK